MTPELSSTIFQLANDILPENAKLMCVMRFGSHLYGLESENSDLDVKGIYIPYTETGEISWEISHKSYNTNKDSKNNNDDIDVSLYSIGKYIDLLSKCNLATLDMLHCSPNNENMIYNDENWHLLYNNRACFYTKQLSRNKVYVRKQIDRYGVSGSKIKAFYEVLKLIETNTTEDTKRLCDIKNIEFMLLKLAENNDNIVVFDDFYNSSNIAFQVSMKSFGPKTQIKHCVSALRKGSEQYANDIVDADNNIYDAKAVAHAVRALYQINDMVMSGDCVLTRHADRLLDFKFGH